MARRASLAGNVRELKHLIVRTVLLTSESVLDAETLQRFARERRASPEREAIDRLAQAVLALPEGEGSKLDLCERTLVASAMEQAHGNKSQAARLLGIDRMALERRLQKRGDS